MTPVDAARLRALAEKATKGPWWAVVPQDKGCGGTMLAAVAPGHQVRTESGSIYPVADLHYIAALSPEKMLTLLDAHKLARDTLVASQASSGCVEGCPCHYPTCAAVRRLDALVTPEVTP